MPGYTVRKPFTYNGRDLGRGDVWTPERFDVDQKLIDLRFVMETTPPAPVAADAAQDAPVVEDVAAVNVAARPQQRTSRGRNAGV